MKLNCKIVSVLFDTGSCYSILPSNFINATSKSDVILSTANGQNLDIKGTVTLDFELGSLKQRHKFYVANVCFPILGCDFIRTFNVYPRLDLCCVMRFNKQLAYFVDPIVNSHYIIGISEHPVVES